MRKINFIVKIGLLSLITDISLAQTVQQIPLRDFFKNPEKKSFEISPDGKYISFLAPYENRMNIFVQKANGGTPIQITHVKDRDIAGYAWKGNDHLVYFRDFGGDENYHAFSITKEGKNEKDLTPYDSVQALPIDFLEKNETDLLVKMNKTNKELFDVYRLNAATGEIKLVAQNPGNIQTWFTDHNGNVRLAITTDGVNQSMLYRKQETDSFKIILNTSFKESVTPLLFSFDNQFIYASSNLGRDKSALVKFDLEKGKEIEVIFEHPEVDIENVDYSEEKQKLNHITFTTWKRERHFINKEDETLFKNLEKKFPNYEVSIVANDKKENTLIILISNDKSPGTYYLYDKKNNTSKLLANSRPWLDEKKLCDMKPISYTSRDGLTIHGYLTLPKGKKAKDLPVIINPHGGPWARDEWEYNPEVQFLANRGYAVLQMNFRGSTGYGKKFWEASFKQWGLKMQDDITDGVQWLIKEGIADPKRIAIYGGSYGGYATLAGVTSTPNLYACGIDYVGPSSMFTLFKSFPPYWKPLLDMTYEMIGNPEKDKEQFIKTSPLLNVDKIQAPLLVAQGAKDPRVNKVESDQIVDALRKRGIDVEYIVKENEGHGFHNEENKFQFYAAMEKFLNKHLLKK